jgi:hypothetical protein
LIRNNLKEESFTLAHGFRGFGLCQLSPLAFKAHSKAEAPW